MQTVHRQSKTRCGALVTMTLLVCSFGAAAVYATEQPAPVVTLPQAVHFIDSKGLDRVIGPGEYRVEVVSSSDLALSTIDGKDTIVISGTRFTMSSPLVQYVPLSNDEHQLSILMPNGEGIIVSGSLSGISSRRARNRNSLGTEMKTSETVMESTK